MKLTQRDRIGLVLLVSTSVAVGLHNADAMGHRVAHIRADVADAGGAVTSAIEVVTTAFVDVNVVTMDGGAVLEHQIVLVEDGFITRIGSVGVVEVPDGARQIEGGGTRFLAPGLTDAHVHLGDDPEAALGLYVAAGVTTVFNLEGAEHHLELRDRVGSGQLLGPTIYTAGPFVDGSRVRSPADADQVVRHHLDRGYDLIKLHGDLDRASFDQLTRIGAERGVPVVGHAPRNLPLDAVLLSDQAALSHAEELIYTEFMSLDASALEPVARRMADAGTWLTPSLATFRNIAAQWGDPAGLAAALDRPEARFLPSGLRREWRSSEWTERDPATRHRIDRMRDFHGPLVLTFHEAGVPLLAGTDAGLPGMFPGFALHDELGALTEAGLSNLDALTTATSNAGRFVRTYVDGRANFGTIRVGARADLLLLDADPRRELDTLRHPLGVMLRGAWLDRGALNALLDRVSHQ